jgi:hypothetical protein
MSGVSVTSETRSAEACLRLMVLRSLLREREVVPRRQAASAFRLEQAPALRVRIGDRLPSGDGDTPVVTARCFDPLGRRAAVRWSLR